MKNKPNFDAKSRHKGKVRTSRAQLDLEVLPSRESTHNTTRWRSRKNYKMIQRFVRSQKGQPWNRIYSELCRKDKAAAELAKDMVKTATFLDADGDVAYIASYGGETKVGSFHGNDTYVHPETGILHYTPIGKDPRQEAPKEYQEIDGRFFIQTAGIWYLAKEIIVPRAEVTYFTTMYRGFWKGDFFHRLEKNKQLNHDELKTAGLVNKPEPKKRLSATQRLSLQYAL